MALRSTHIFLLLVLVLIVGTCTGSVLERYTLHRPQSPCSGLTTVGDCISGDEEMAMESESARRGLRGNGRHISYNALRRSRAPCSQRGASYYDCNGRTQVNSYRRTCSVITRCARILT